MNTAQVQSLSNMADNFLERAHAYMEQAEACDFATDDLEKQAERLERQLEEQGDVDEQTYRRLAKDMLKHVDDILSVLDEAESPDERLLEIATAVKNSSALIEAVDSMDARVRG